jgi:hypothetical protein
MTTEPVDQQKPNGDSHPELDEVEDGEDDVNEEHPGTGSLKFIVALLKYH